ISHRRWATCSTVPRRGRAWRAASSGCTIASPRGTTRGLPRPSHPIWTNRIDMPRRYQETTDVTLLCGVDEAGRGPLAGAVFAAAVVLDPKRTRINNLHDSKVLDAETREKLAER